MVRRAIGILIVGVALQAAAPAQGAYAPRLAVSVTPATPGAASAITTTVTQSLGESATRSVALTFPAGFAARVPGDELPPCPVEVQDSCPPASHLGTATAQTLLGTFSGPVSYGGPSPQGIRLIARLESPLAILDQTLIGYVVPTDSGFVARFDGLPNLLVLRLELALDGAPRGLTINPSACGSGEFVGRFESHGGDVAESRAPVEITGCPNVAPKLSGVRLVPSRIERRRTTTVSFTLSEPATVIVTVRRAPRGRKLERILFRASAGPTRLRGVARHAPGGLWRVQLRAIDPQGASDTVVRTLRVKR